MMNNTRREFIKASGIAAFGISFGNQLSALGQNPMVGFPRSTPESQGFDSQGILNFLEGIKESGLEWHSFMLLKHGHVIAEAWWKPFEAANKHTLYSLSKSFTSTAIGFLVAEGKITVDDQVIKFFPESLPSTVSENLKAMKVKHLLTMNTGHDTDTMPAIRAKPDQEWVKSFLEHPIIHQPSTHFLYNTGATYMLGAILHKITGKTLEEYLQPRLFAPLNIVGYDWEKSPQGLNTAGYGLRVSTEDIAKLGQLYLQKGEWQGKQLLPESWVEEATNKRTNSQAGDNDWAQGYGYQFWRCKPGFYRGDGAFGQFCMVMPEYDTVLAMTCESFNLQKTMDVAYENLLPAIRQNALPENPKTQAKINSKIEKLSLPVPIFSKSSPFMNKHPNVWFNLDDNSFGIPQIGLGLFADAGVIRIKEGNGFKKIGFGWEKWQVNKNGNKNYFPVPNRTHMPSKIAATGTWLHENTLQINLKFIDAVHGDRLTFVFDDKKVTLSFLNSVSENTKNSPEKREPITGIMT